MICLRHFYHLKKKYMVYTTILHYSNLTNPLVDGGTTETSLIVVDHGGGLALDDQTLRSSLLLTATLPSGSLLLALALLQVLHHLLVHQRLEATEDGSLVLVARNLGEIVETRPRLIDGTTALHRTLVHDDLLVPTIRRSLGARDAHLGPIGVGLGVGATELALLGRVGTRRRDDPLVVRESIRQTGGQIRRVETKKVQNRSLPDQSVARSSSHVFSDQLIIDG